MYDKIIKEMKETSVSRNEVATIRLHKGTQYSNCL